MKRISIHFLSILLLIGSFSCMKGKVSTDITILSPANNFSVEHFSALSIQIETDPNNTVAYFIDNNLVYSTVGNYYDFEILTTNYEIGDHTIRVDVESNEGAKASAELSISIVPSTQFETGMVSDIENNQYHTVKIGDQWWMAENLRTTQYNNGKKIETKTSNYSWSNLEVGGYCWYDGDSAMYANSNGALYNWYTVETGKLCPNGWHVPSDQEWQRLEKYLGMSSVEAGSSNYRGENMAELLKAACFWNWNGQINGNGTNQSGFSALPSGFRDDSGQGFSGIYSEANWWTSTDDSPVAWDNVPFGRTITDRDHTIYRGGALPGSGYSVRCIKD